VTGHETVVLLIEVGIIAFAGLVFAIRSLR
jgi:hypothetical protein